MEANIVNGCNRITCTATNGDHRCEGDPGHAGDHGDKHISWERSTDEPQVNQPPAIDLSSATPTQLRRLAETMDRLEAFRKWKESLSEVEASKLGISFDFAWAPGFHDSKLIRYAMVRAIVSNLGFLVSIAEQQLVRDLSDARVALASGRGEMAA